MRHFDISLLFPKAYNDYQGPKIAIWFLVIYNIVGTIRSCIHIFAPDSGAQSIATMNVHVSGGQNIIGLLAQFGGAQLMMALLIWVGLWRFRILVPLMIAETALEQLTRILIGHLKPLETLSTPPGAIGSQILLPIALVIFLLSLTRKKATDKT